MPTQNEIFDLKSKHTRAPWVSVRALVSELSQAGLLTAAMPTVGEANGCIVVDSRQLVADCIYIAIPGQNRDGHDFIPEAVKAGAALIICERSMTGVSTPQLVVRNSREAWAWACSFAWNHPGRDVKLVGVTGTNGKTSTVWMIRGILAAFGHEVATIGTLGFYVGKRHHETSHTTPDPDALYAMLRYAKNQGCGVVAMEVSSHALIQEKLSPLRFCAGIMTSFSQDHLDFHGTMQNYLDAKLSFFQRLLAPDASVILHEAVFPLLSSSLPKKHRVHTYGSSKECELLVSHSSRGLRGATAVTLAGLGRDPTTLIIPFIGGIFAENFAAAMLASSQIERAVFAESSSRKISEGIRAVPGRLEPVATSRPWRPLVLVDYAHTPDALEKSLTVARSMTSGRLICVFGCGGDRDKSKRPIMGQIASKLSDIVFVTSDNPRSESPDEILNDIARGIPKNASASLNADRSAAIHDAIGTAWGGDTVLIAGKGHENYQIIGSEKRHFSDVEEGQAALLHTRTWCVIGGGLSGTEAAVYLANQGERVVVSDGGKVPSEKRSRMESSNVSVFDGGHNESHLAGCNAVVLSPGVAKENLLVQLAKKESLPLVTEIDLGFEFFRGSLFAVTGTNGKSTTCALGEHVLKSMGRKASACGNIGLPPTALATKSWDHSSFLICELSSYQLEHTKPLAAKVALFTSFSFDHLARHGSIDEYFRCKWRVSEGLADDGLFVLRADAYDYAITNNVTFPSCQILVVHDHRLSLKNFTSTHNHWWIEDSSIASHTGVVCSLSALELVGLHNRINAAFVIAAVGHTLGCSLELVAQHLRGFTGLAYRCQPVGKTADGLLIINDSKSTNLESTLIALSASQDPVILLMGGAGKGEPYKSLIAAKDKIAQLLVFGASRDAIARDVSAEIKTTTYGPMADAVNEALKLAKKLRAGILFSPGCASFDEFQNYEHRGRVFNELIQDQSAF